MSRMIDSTWLLLLPFLAVLVFSVWALWNFSDELRAARRRRVRRGIYGYRVRIYLPERITVPHLSQSHDKEAA